MTRLNYAKASPQAYKTLMALQGHVLKSGLEPALIHLVYLRVSQVNGCAFCIDMHAKDLVALGETSERMNLLSVWHEAPQFTPRERVALAFAEALTKLGPEGVPDAVYAPAQTELGDALLVELTMAVCTINAWNRMSIAFRIPPGAYKATVHA